MQSSPIYAMNSVLALRGRLTALSACAEKLDVRGRAAMVSVAFDIASPSQQFLSDLYDVCTLSVASSECRAANPPEDSPSPRGSVSEECVSGCPATQLRATCTAAALHYLSQQDGRVVQQFLNSFFLPLLSHSTALPDKTCRLQTCTGLVALLVSNRLWPQLEQLVRQCCHALEAAANVDPSGGCKLPLPVACTLLTVTVQQLCPLGSAAEELTAGATPTSSGAGGNTVTSSAPAIKTLRWLLSQLRSALRSLLPSPSASARQSALRVLVPITLTVAQACGGSDLASTVQDAWHLALDLLGGDIGGSSRSEAIVITGRNGGGQDLAATCSAVSVCVMAQRIGLALLVSVSGVLLDPAAGVDVRGCERFWDLLRTCLGFPADVDALERKRAMLLLHRLAPPGQMDSPGWAIWAALYDILDEFPIHLVAPVWEKIDQLHTPAPEFRTETVVPKSYIPRKKELKQRKAASASAAHDSTAGAVDTDARPVPQAWQCVLWSRALQHGNVQVQRLGMRTFLQRDWRSADVLRSVPLGFVKGVLLPAIARDIHYRGGAAEAEVLDVQALAAAWLRGWFAAASIEQRIEGLLAIRGMVSGTELSRLGIQQLMRCVTEAARCAAADGQLLRAVAAAATASPPPDASSATASFPAAMLGTLRAVLVYLTTFTGIPYKHSVRQSVISTAAAVVPVEIAGVGSCMRLLLELPPPTLEPGGELRNQVRSWLLGRSNVISADGDAVAAATAALSRSEVATVSAWFQEVLDDYWSQTLHGGAGAGGSAAAPIVQMLLLLDDVEAVCAVVVGRLRTLLYGMYGRPYLQASETHHALVLLRELLAALSRPTVPSALQSAVLGLLVTCCDDICSAASHAADAFLEADPPTAAGSLDRADAAWACVSLALVLTCRSSDPSAGPVTRRLATTLLALLARLAKTPLPAARYSAVVTGLRVATAAAEALRQAAAVSAHIGAIVAERLDPSALAIAALRDSTAAATAAVAASIAASGSGRPDTQADKSQLLSEVEAAKWPLLDAATALAGAVEGTANMAVGGLQPVVVLDVLSQAVAALGEYPEGQVLPLLRCLRRCWVAVARGGPELQAAAVEALGTDMPSPSPPQDATAANGSSSGSSTDPASTALEALCWPVVRALWNALCATPRRTSPLCAAFVNTALLPCLYVQQSDSQLRALHGPQGPCRWLLSRLLEWGGTSSRFLLLLACQLGSFLPLQPVLVECYGREIQLLLLWGSRKGSTYDPDGTMPDGPEVEELSAVAGPPLPGLVTNAAIGTEVAPRVALLCCIHQIAEKAGCIWPPTGTANNVAAAAGSGTGAPQMESPDVAVTETRDESPKRRPVIIFGDSSEWEEQASGLRAALQDPSNMVRGSKPRTVVMGAMATAIATAATTGTDVGDSDGDLADYGAPPPSDPKDPSLLAGQLLWRQLLSVGLDDPLLSTDKVRNGSELHRQKVRLWQSLVVLSSFVPREECGAAVTRMLGQVNGNNPPTVKQYIEAVVAALVLREPSVLFHQILPFLTNYSRHMTGLGSYILIAAQVLLHSPPPVQRHHLRPLLLAICPWLMCHGHNVRTYAQLVMWALLQRFPPESALWAHSIGDLGYLHHMLAFIQSNADLVRLRRNIGDPILHWSPAAMSHPARVFASAPDGVCLAGSPIEQATFEGAPSTLVDRIQTFLVSERHRLRDELADRTAEREFAPQDLSKTIPAAAAADGAAVGTAAGPGGGIGDFQRKITPEAFMATLMLQGPGLAAQGAGGGLGGSSNNLAAVTDQSVLVDLLQQEEAEEAEAAQDWKSSSGGRQLRHDVLLVASLIDKLPNLAGLARTCEVLGAGRLVLADLAATRDPLFTSVSVTAEQWLPMEEVKPAALLAWLERRAAEGYTLVGLEQTAESVRLPDYRWPAKVVLVLGREKEGIPPEVLSLLDATLEIPQRGIIRSLNVHVSGAIALYEYVRQMQFQQLPSAVGN
ncbi:hypothetical protein VaNZ11_014743 [Volvox africanus]|uniref:tRNA/rRNA methyltransferase SpoU type domain-containing protein n=1 Tax=Volvox africanus TaxID=51714 RepID=A0ABQ5SKR5_9CHLO|nr:hypothetical protein VaNZ11_014743 [Volvox africanus]